MIGFDFKHFWFIQTNLVKNLSYFTSPIKNLQIKIFY